MHIASLNYYWAPIVAGMWPACPSYCVTCSGGTGIGFVDIFSFVVIPGCILIDSVMVSVGRSTSSPSGYMMAPLGGMSLGV